MRKERLLARAREDFGVVERLERTAEIDQRQAEADAGLDVLRIGAERPLERRDGFTRLAERGERHAEAGMDFGAARLKRERLAVDFKRLRRMSAIQRHVGEIVLDDGVVGPKLRCARQMEQRFAEQALAMQDPAEIVVGLVEVGVEIERLAIGRDRFFGVSFLLRQHDQRNRIPLRPGGAALFAIYEGASLRSIINQSLMMRRPHGARPPSRRKIGGPAWDSNQAIRSCTTFALPLRHRAIAVVAPGSLRRGQDIGLPKSHRRR